jgi:hypothetical protein
LIVLQTLNGFSDAEAVGGGDVRSAVEGGLPWTRGPGTRTSPDQSPGHQSPRGDHGAVGAYRVGDGFGAGRNVRLEGVAESRGQRVGGRYNVRVRAADPEVLDGWAQ